MGTSSSSIPSRPTSSTTYQNKIDDGRLNFQKEVNAEPVVMFTKRRCGYCDLAKTTFDNELINYREIDIDAVRERDGVDMCVRLVNELVTNTRQKTVPQIFICGKFIGGYDQLIELRNMHRLHETIAQCAKR